MRPLTTFTRVGIIAVAASMRAIATPHAPPPATEHS